MLALRYKNYAAEVDFDWMDLCWIGRVVNSDDRVGFRGKTIEEAEQDFHDAVDAYLAAGEVLAPVLDEAV